MFKKEDIEKSRQLDKEFSDRGYESSPPKPVVEFAIEPHVDKIFYINPVYTGTYEKTGEDPESLKEAIKEFSNAQEPISKEMSDIIEEEFYNLIETPSEKEVRYASILVFEKDDAGMCGDVVLNYAHTDYKVAEKVVEDINKRSFQFKAIAYSQYVHSKETAEEILKIIWEDHHI
jgi:hypothetical protein